MSLENLNADYKRAKNDVKLAQKRCAELKAKIKRENRQLRIRDKIDKLLKTGNEVMVEFKDTDCITTYKMIDNMIYFTNKYYSKLTECLIPKYKNNFVIKSYKVVNQYDVGDAVILSDKFDNKLVIIENIEGNLIEAKDIIYLLSYIKRKATLKDLQNEVKMMFDKNEYWKLDTLKVCNDSNNNIWCYIGGGVWSKNFPNNIFNYKWLLNFIKNAKPIKEVESKIEFENKFEESDSFIEAKGIHNITIEDIWLLFKKINMIERNQKKLIDVVNKLIKKV